MATPESQPASIQTARAVVQTLIAHGVQHVVTSPGSRCAPLLYALSDAVQIGAMTAHVRVDERVAGFTALGLAKASKKPVAIIMTSGTAVANVHPAVLEAHHTGVPLVILSADRPHELRGTGANQTTVQSGIFGDAVRSNIDIPAATGDHDDMQDVVNWVSRSVSRAVGVRSGYPGPVQVNICFREPLVPDPQGVGWLPDGTEFKIPDVLPARPRLVPTPIPNDKRTVVVAGAGAGPAAHDVAVKAGWPLLAEPVSGARMGANAIVSYRSLLGTAYFGKSIERVIVYGRPTISREVSALMARRDIELIVVDPTANPWFDPARNANLVVPELAPAPGESAESIEWLSQWQRADMQFQVGVLSALQVFSGLTGPLVARSVWNATQDGDNLVVGSSKIVRDLDSVAVPPAKEVNRSIYANRGLAGIDGLISTATGIAAGSRGYTRLLLGDLTFLHDVGGLNLPADEPDPDVQIVVVNDSGGGIFSLLEHSGLAEQTQNEELQDFYRSTFNRFFTTPHQVSIESLAAAYGLPHVKVTDERELAAALSVRTPGRSIVEAVVDGRTHQAVQKAIREVSRSAAANVS